jgi:hypothetical protein
LRMKECLKVNLAVKFRKVATRIVCF